VSLKLADPRVVDRDVEQATEAFDGNGHVLGAQLAQHPRPRERRRQPAWLAPASVDAAMLGVASLVFFATQAGQDLGWALLLVFNAATLSLLIGRRAESPRLRPDVLDDIRTAVTATALATLTVISIDALVSAEPRSTDALGLWLLASILLMGGRSASAVASSWRRQSGRGATTLVVGAGRVGHLTASRLLANPEFGLRPIGFLDAEPLVIQGRPLPVPVLGANGDLERVVADHDVEYVLVTFSTASHDAMLALLDECQRLGVRALVVPRFFERVPTRIRVTHVGGLPLLEMFPTSPRSFQFAVKYALDRVVAFASLVLLSPLLVTISLAVVASLGRPVLYRQHRVSLDGRHFEMLKFRTMQAPFSEEEDAKQFDPEVAPGGVEGEDRRTRVGAFLRRWSLDELPQLINVLGGEMSLVGPRPERPEYVEYFREHVRRYDGRLRTKAGVTGWAQIHRLRGNTSISDRVEWDNYYIENFSLWLDVKILLRTIPAALRGGVE
jgi:exopolysaccharide biosynthesis polyprenyl glycosylphosphotransferase